MSKILFWIATSALVSSWIIPAAAGTVGIVEEVNAATEVIRFSPRDQSAYRRSWELRSPGVGADGSGVIDWSLAYRGARRLYEAARSRAVQRCTRSGGVDLDHSGVTERISTWMMHFRNAPLEHRTPDGQPIVYHQNGFNRDYSSYRVQCSFQVIVRCSGMR